MLVLPYSLVYYVCVLRPLADSEQLPTRTHRSAEVLKSPGGDGDGETITPEPKKKTRKDKKEKKKVKDKERTASFNTTLDALSFSLTCQRRHRSKSLNPVHLCWRQAIRM